eukprot:466522_1
MSSLEKTESLIFGYVNENYGDIICDVLLQLINKFYEDRFIWEISSDTLRRFLNRDKGYKTVYSKPFNYNHNQHNITFQFGLFMNTNMFKGHNIIFGWKIIERNNIYDTLQIHYKLNCVEIPNSFEHKGWVQPDDSNNIHGWTGAYSIIKPLNYNDINILTFMCQIIDCVKVGLKDELLWDDYNAIDLYTFDNFFKRYYN